MLTQEPDRVTEAREPWPAGDFPRVVTKRAPTADEWTALRFAWRVCAHVKSNTIIFTTADRTLAVGAGQMSRVDAVKVATMKAAGALSGSVAARTPSSRSATASTRSPRPAPRPSSSRADRSRTRR